MNGSSAETKLSGIKIEKGDTIDFVVDARTDPENDAFSWAPVVKVRGRYLECEERFRRSAAAAAFGMGALCPGAAGNQ